MPEQDETPQVEKVEKQDEAQSAESKQQEEPFDKDRAMATIEKLRGIEKQAKKDAAELAAFKAEAQKKADAELSEMDKLKKQLAEQQQTTLKTMAENVALSAGLPVELAGRLQGTTKQELEADAANLAKLLPAQQKPAPKIAPSNPQNAQQNETPEQMRQRLFPNQAESIFDPAGARAKGGGVFS